MKSPFPGMDPYLEQYWRDVHTRFILYSADQLQRQLPPPLRARVEERVFVESGAGEYRVVYPDVHVVEWPNRPAGATAAGQSALAEPVVFDIRDEPVTQRYLEIIDAGSGNRVVTVIEFLSPSNKVRGEGQDLYLQKQREVREAGASLVEIDLTRAGRRVTVLPPERVPVNLRGAYEVCVWRAWKPSKVEVYPIRLREPLPTVRIPLRQTDADAPLNLQSLVDQAYENGRYDDLDYRREPVPPLEADDAAWTDELLRGKGLR